MGKKTPALHHCKTKYTMETSYAYIFPETFKIMNIFLVLPIGTALVHNDHFSYDKSKATQSPIRL